MFNRKYDWYESPRVKCCHGNDITKILSSLLVSKNMLCTIHGIVVVARAFQFRQKSFDSIRFANLIHLPLVH